jgi:hypothetical protein
MSTTRFGRFAPSVAKEKNAQQSTQIKYITSRGWSFLHERDWLVLSNFRHLLKVTAKSNGQN